MIIVGGLAKSFYGLEKTVLAHNYIHLHSLPKSYFKICITTAESTGKMKGKSRILHL